MISTKCSSQSQPSHLKPLRTLSRHLEIQAQSKYIRFYIFKWGFQRLYFWSKLDTGHLQNLDVSSHLICAFTGFVRKGCLFSGYWNVSHKLTSRRSRCLCLCAGNAITYTWVHSSSTQGTAGYIREMTVLFQTAEAGRKKLSKSNLIASKKTNLWKLSLGEVALRNTEHDF